MGRRLWRATYGGQGRLKEGFWDHNMKRVIHVAASTFNEGNDWDGNGVTWAAKMTDPCGASAFIMDDTSLLPISRLVCFFSFLICCLFIPFDKSHDVANDL